MELIHLSQFITYHSNPGFAQRMSIAYFTALSLCGALALQCFKGQ